MTLMLIGLALFLVPHALRAYADDWRRARIAALGAGGWKLAYSAVAILGFALMVYGYAQARQQPVFVWAPPMAMRHVMALLMAVAMVLLAAAYVPGTWIKARLRHPMTLAVKTWAFAHLLANGWLHEIVFFGAFLAWSVVVYRAARARDSAAPAAAPRAAWARDAIAVGLGLAALVAFTVPARVAGTNLHLWLFGVEPFVPST